MLNLPVAADLQQDDVSSAYGGEVCWSAPARAPRRHRHQMRPSSEQASLSFSRQLQTSRMESKPNTHPERLGLLPAPAQQETELSERRRGRPWFFDAGDACVQLWVRALAPGLRLRVSLSPSPCLPAARLQIPNPVLRGWQYSSLGQDSRVQQHLQSHRAGKHQQLVLLQTLDGQKCRQLPRHRGRKSRRQQAEHEACARAEFHESCWNQSRRSHRQMAQPVIPSLSGRLPSQQAWAPLHEDWRQRRQKLLRSATVWQQP
mmetsp:Transcript_14483/g.36407  ORF Transcript_14483/g.36407 Transcript_14483/m.36407 type:complete len:260 (+) Transcript_14483:904-1683(+)